MKKRVIILGAGGFAREVADVFRDLGPNSGYEVLGFVERDASRKGELLNDLYILGGVDDVGDLALLHAVAGSGDIGPRERQVAEITEHGLLPVTVVHPSVIMSPFVMLGEGTIVCAGTILTNNIVIGKHVVLNLGVTVGHDVTIGACSVVSPGVHISGWVTIGSDCYLGTGAVVLPRVTIGDGAVVGAGAVVTKDVAPGSTVVGIPARPIGSR
jgi:sugar O-acyltransferase (sialic acid O-acetyltransferase NeuD family)